MLIGRDASVPCRQEGKQVCHAGATGALTLARQVLTGAVAEPTSSQNWVATQFASAIHWTHLLRRQTLPDRQSVLLLHSTHVLMTPSPPHTLDAQARLRSQPEPRASCVHAHRCRC